MSPRPLAHSTAAILGPLALGGCPAPDDLERAAPPTGALELCLPISAGDDTLVAVEGIVAPTSILCSACRLIPARRATSVAESPSCVRCRRT